MLRNLRPYALLTLFTLALVTACTDSSFFEERLTELLGTEYFSELRGATNGFHDTFHHYRFVTKQDVIDTFIARDNLQPAEARIAFEKDLIIYPLLYNSYKVKWWRPEEVAGQQVYIRDWQGDETPSLKLAFNPHTGVAYLIEGYP